LVEVRNFGGSPKRSIAELGSIGRNINQIAKAVSGGGEVPGSVRGKFWAMLKICTAQLASGEIA
jgi:hypothetical protein